jgi:nicotinamidase/pyrazinamidase
MIIDVQRDFCPGGALPVPEGDRVIEALNKYISLFLDLNLPIIATRDWHPEDSSHFKSHGGRWPEHCVHDSNGAEFHPLLMLPKSSTIVSKGIYPEEEGYSAFDGYTEKGSRLEEFLARTSIDTIYAAGLATDYCVKTTVIEALKRGYKVFLLEDAVKGVDLNKGDSERAIEEMSSSGARLIRLTELKGLINNPADTIW